MKIVMKPKSLRAAVFMSTGVLMVVFSVAFIMVYSKMTTSMLHQSEIEDVDRQYETVTTMFDKQRKSIHDKTRYLATWEETIEYVKGEREDYIENNWYQSTPLEHFDADYLIIKDVNGDDCYTEYLDSVSGKHKKMPENLSMELTPYAFGVIEEANRLAETAKAFDLVYREGYIIVDDIPYHICVMPIIMFGSDKECYGAIIMGNQLSNEHYQKLTGLKRSTFNVIKNPEEVLEEGVATRAISDERIDIIIARTALDGTVLHVVMETDRNFYMSGYLLTRNISFILVAFVVVFVISLYAIFLRIVILPIEELSGEIRGLNQDERIDNRKYENRVEFAALFHAVNDLTEHLNKSKMSIEVMENILNGMDAMIYVTDMGTDELLFMNDKIKTHYGLEENVTGKICYELIQKDKSERCSFCPKFNLMQNPDQLVQWELHSDVTGRFYKNTDCLIPWTNGKTVHLQHAVDITDIKKLEHELIDAKEAAEEGSLAKGNFLANMSHEIRTPMNAIIGMTNIAKGTEDIERIKYCLNKVDDAADHLLGVINDILDMSKIDAGKLELSILDFQLEHMLQRVNSVTSFKVDQKKQDFIIKVDKDVPAAIKTDQQRLTQVLTNLLSNAVKFTPEEGNIRLLIHKLSEDGDECTLLFEVIDDGIGISSQQKKKLFQSFEQADGSISRRFGGTGLGLAISKRIVELMSGEIKVDSEIGKGLRFYFTIRVKIGKSGYTTRLNPDINWKKVRLLVVDDAPEVREYFEDITVSIGLQCQTAADGFEACRMIEEDNAFDIIFVDWMMPGMDGVELTRKIRNKYGSNTIVIMISAAEWGLIEDLAIDAGVDRFISKPLLPSSIIDCINQCVKKQTLGGIEAQSKREFVSGDRIFEGKCLILAEDIDINREIVMELLAPTGITIDCAENGKVAYELFKNDQERYHLILMDIHMPEMDGYEATKMIRNIGTEQALNIPIIALTANVFREDIEHCLAAGMDDHIGKPLNFDDTMNKIKRYIL